MIDKSIYVKCYLLALIFLNTITLFSQTSVRDYKYRIQFTDKKNSPYSISEPSEYLSEKAISRRTIQNISIKENDLPVNPSYVDSINKTGVRILHKSKWLNSLTIDNVDSIKLVKIKSYDFVLKIEKTAQILDKKKYKIILPEKDLNKELTATTSIPGGISNNNITDNGIYQYGFSYDQVNMIGCDSLHSMGFRGKGLTIAVLDAGFLKADQLPIFDTLRNDGRILGTKDFVKAGGNVYELGTHGMMVLSTMAGNIPEVYLGTAPDAGYWLLRTEDADTEYIIEEDNWVSAAEFADSVGVDIINSSLGYTRFMDSTEDHKIIDLNGITSRISKAATIASDKGIIVVNSAGNEGYDQSWNYLISFPADAERILSVGAVDKYGKYANFSSRGPTSDGRLKPEIVAMGLGAAVSYINGDIIAANGTSFSSPIIAGMVACIWQTSPDKTNVDVMNSIFKSCNHYSYPDVFTGYGIPNAYEAYKILLGKDNNIYKFENSLNVSSYPYNNEIYITFVLSNNSYIEAEIYDITGKIVYKSREVYKTAGYSFIKLSEYKDLSKGIYFLKLHSNDKVYVKKLMKLG